MTASTVIPLVVGFATGIDFLSFWSDHWASTDIYTHWKHASRRCALRATTARTNIPDFLFLLLFFAIRTFIHSYIYSRGVVLHGITILIMIKYEYNNMIWPKMMGSCTRSIHWCLHIYICIVYVSCVMRMKPFWTTTRNITLSWIF